VSVGGELGGEGAGDGGEVRCEEGGRGRRNPDGEGEGERAAGR
jgi:hypothetical protein